MFKGAWTLAYIATIVFANLLLIWLPPVSIFGTFLPPAIVASGFVFVLRDFAQREIGHFVLIAILVASAVTYVLAGPEVAAASTTAFLVAELADWAVYSITKKPLSQRILFSSVFSVPVDTFVFFLALGILDKKSFILGVGVKMIGTAIFWAFLVKRERRISELASAPLSANHVVGGLAQ
ncbi:hypothetical protein [Aurantimonas coralicida]|uniref:hypothetical protein n=1 Tax=Aurantimonas coralicida TaxID=182270 RepID=UPI001D196502|nr:hypothetical protein [Aurantimonas coralicida]MCC4298327.1 hypothetical protein [Aurantimonas coralicida]